MPSPAEKGSAFAELHAGGCFLMPNAWDAGSAKLLAAAGFKAIGTTSAGLALGLGRRDGIGAVTLDEALANVRAIAEAVPLPVSADFENAYADDPEGVAANVRRCAEAGAAGCSVEDWDGRAFYPADLAAERVRAAVEAARSLDRPFTITARAEAFLYGMDDPLDAAIDRLQRFAAAGAECLYAPGVRDRDAIRRLVAASERPLNVLIGMAGMATTLDEMAGLGVRRLSAGAALYRAAQRGFVEAMTTLRAGRSAFADRALPEDALEAALGVKPA